MLRHAHRFLAGLIVIVGAAGSARAELRSLEIIQREPFAGGMAFGEVGPYERIVAVAKFEVDPSHPRNKAIVDLDKAARNSAGKVEFESDVFILAPKDPAKGNGAIFYDVNNRGNKLALGMFNRGSGGNDPTSAEHAGNGFLMRRGYTVVWCGWIGEMLPGDSRLLLRAPFATDSCKPIRGVVRQEITTDVAVETMPLSQRPNHGSYVPSVEGEKNGVLTWRAREEGERVVIPRDQWSLERLPIPPVQKGVGGTLGQINLKLSGGFRPGFIYELIYDAENPIVQGLGYAATRDLISFLHHDTSKQNPLAPGGKSAINRAHGFGVSQSGRFLRNYLDLGFNADEKDRMVFDGLIPHVAGGGLGFFNHRFAQPTRHNGQHENHTYPADIFPFTYGESTDPFSKQTDGILLRTLKENPKCLPKVMHTQSAAEYWHRSGSLVHTDPLGAKDAAIPANVRIYAFGGTQHGPAADPPGRGAAADNLVNPGDYRPQLRALLDALDAWVKDGKEPPASVYPRIDQGMLVDWKQSVTQFPALPGVRYPEVIQQPPFLDFGSDFASKGIITVEPPKVLGHYKVLVPRSGPDGNDLGCLSPAEVSTPLATYTGWNLRRREVGAEGMLANLMGSYIPFPKTAAERKQTGDPRLSLEERYGSFDAYKKQFSGRCEEMVKQRVLLQEDADRLIAGRDKLRELFAK